MPTLKEGKAVRIEEVLARRGLLRTLSRRGDRLVGPCPVHCGDSPAAFVVSLSRNIWYCFTRCGGGGDVVELVRRLDGCSYADVAWYLATFAHTEEPSSNASPAVRSASPQRTFRPFIRPLPLDHDSPWLRAKGIQAQTARLFEAGHYNGPGFLRGCIGVRIHDPDGRPLGYAGRRLNPQEARVCGKWKLPPGLPASRVLYGFHRARPVLAARGLAVVECPWGVMRLAQLDIPAVALLGTHASDEQKRLLTMAPRLTVLLDGDLAGQQGACRLHNELAGHHASVVTLPDGHDPDDLSDRQLAALLTSFIPGQPAAASRT